MLGNADFVDDVRDNDPLSKKWVAYSSMCWANAIGHVTDQAVARLRETNPDDADTRAAVDGLIQRQGGLHPQQTTAYDQAPLYERTVIPGTVSKEQHPVALGQKDAKGFLLASLKQAGVPEEEIARLTSKESYAAAIQKVANENPQWRRQPPTSW